jgi:cytochrome c peroxidase
VLLGLAAAACGRAEPVAGITLRVETNHEQLGAITPIERPSGLDPKSVALGEELFRDRRLSGNGTQSCSSCHDLANGGADGLSHSLGSGGLPGAVNAPTVFNAALNFRQFWDGRAITLEDQVDGPVENPLEMASTWPEVVVALRADLVFAKRFQQVYAEGITPATIRNAIATFERSLATPDAPFDRYLSGDTDALSAQAQRGYQLFKSSGCTACHQGQGIGGNMFQQLGVMGDYFADRGHPSEADLGRYNVTHDEADRHVFKVPSLRNVARTAPYFHDGSVARLEDAVRLMARYQLGRDLEDDEVSALVAFLESLTGVYAGRPL